MCFVFRLTYFGDEFPQSRRDVSYTRSVLEVLLVRRWCSLDVKSSAPMCEGLVPLPPPTPKMELYLDYIRRVDHWGNCRPRWQYPAG